MHKEFAIGFFLVRVVAWLMVLVPINPVFPFELIGQASVIDGDTLEIHGTRIRIWGINAPESNQLCRGEAKIAKSSKN